MSLAIFTSFWLFAMPANAETSVQTLKRIQESSPKRPCDAVNSEIAPWKIKAESTLTLERAKRALEIIQSMRFPTSKERDTMVGAIKEDPVSAFGDYLSQSLRSCDFTRLILSQSLVLTATVKESPKELHNRIKSILKLELLRPRSPTLVAVGTDLTLLQVGVEKGLWKLEPEDAKRLSVFAKKFKVLRSEISNLITEA